MSRTKEIESWRIGDRDVAYYDAHAPAYAAATLEVDLSDIYERFLRHVRPGGLILDVGSGSGRDTLAFLRRGFGVEAIEPSSALATLSYGLTGVRPRIERVQELKDEARFDGVWACASLVHVGPNELLGAVKNLARAMRPHAPMYLSFKHGEGQRIAADGRPFTDMTELAIQYLVSRVHELRVVDTWLSEGEGIARGRDAWTNVIAKRS